MRWIARLPLLCALLALQCQALSAQDAAAPTPADVIVRARERDQALRAFVAAMTDRDSGRQIARWNQQMCPLVVGIAPTQAAQMEARIGEVAGTLGVKRARKCTTPLLIVIDNDANGVARAFAKRFPTNLPGETVVRVRGFVNSTKPVRWIGVKNPCGFGGCFAANSRLISAEASSLKALLIVVDGRQIGRTMLAELSDYVAFIALAYPPPDKPWPATSIMALFDRDRSNGALDRLSDDDLNYLAGLYHSRPYATGAIQRTAIINYMKKDKKDK